MACRYVAKLYRFIAHALVPQAEKEPVQVMKELVLCFHNFYKLQYESISMEEIFPTQVVTL